MAEKPQLRKAMISRELHGAKLMCIVLISLSSVNPPPKFSFPERRIFLSKKRTSIEIGRTSKRNASFEAARSNAWFDSPVMSRKHALITFDSEKQVGFLSTRVLNSKCHLGLTRMQKVFLKDTGSLHGTYKNDVRLETNVNSEILNGDKVKFGAIIERGLHKYPPCLINTSIKFGSREYVLHIHFVFQS
jgi:pSer/pThr/pTyr-binding forkhead associated (FHA) protein